MAVLEEALQSCRDEVASHIAQLGQLETAHHRQVDQLRIKVAYLAPDIHEVQLPSLFR